MNAGTIRFVDYIMKGPWGSQDILMAFEANDPGSNPGGPVRFNG